MRRECAPSGIACKIWKYDNGLRCVLNSFLGNRSVEDETPAGLRPVDRRGAGPRARAPAPLLRASSLLLVASGAMGHSLPVAAR